MSFDLDIQGAQEIDERAARDGVPLSMPDVDPGFFSGTARASLQGLARGTVGKGALLLGDSVTPVLRPTAQAVDKLVGSSLDSWLDEQQRRTRQMLVDLRPDPLTTGWAGQVMGGLFDLGSSALVFTPEGAAVLEGYSRRTELVGEGVDPNTAAAVGAVSGVATLLGVKAPVTLGRAAAGQSLPTVARNAGYGAAVGVGTGVAQRGSTRDVLERAGYPDQAALNEPYDRTSVAADAVLGALFSGGAAAMEARFGAKAQEAVDAALELRRASHAGLETAPGVPADVKAAAAHAQAFDVAMEQALRNEPVNVGDALADTTFVRPTAQRRELAGELQSHVADLLPAPAFRAPANAPRGIRTNNPGNLRATGERWQGQTGADGGFVTFDSPQAGVRALARTLITYQDRHGLNTLKGIISRWAPPGENNTPAYVLAVARAMGIEPTARLDMHDPAIMRGLVQAIVRHENGQQPYPEALIRAGVDDALSGPVSTAPAADLPVSRPDGGAEGPAGRTGDISVDRGGADAGAVPQELRAELESKLGKLEASVLQHGGEAPRGSSDAGGVGQAAPMEFTTAKGANPAHEGVGTRATSGGLIGTGRSGAERASGQGLVGERSPEALASMRALAANEKAPLDTSAWQDLGNGFSARAFVNVVDGQHLPVQEVKAPNGAVIRRGIGLTGTPYGELEGSGTLDSVMRGVPFAEFSRYFDAGSSAGAGGESGPGGKAEAVSRMTHATTLMTSDGGLARSHDAGAPARQSADPAVSAAAEVAALRPDMLVAMEDGTELPAAEVLARAEAERVQAEQDARAFEAAAHCFLRS